MTNKTTMPEPVAYAVFAENGNIRLWSREPGDLPDADSLGPMCHLITTTQAEAYAEARVREVQRWQPIETAPKSGRSILLGFVNSHGNWRTMLGRWISKEEILNEWEDGDLFDEGWYEISVEADDVPNCWLTNPSHWMPLPPPPTK